MATVDVTCAGCKFDYWLFIATFHRKDDLCYQFLREHGVLPTAVECPECHTPCRLRSDRRVWYCGRYRKLPKKKRSKQCNFSVSDFKGTFLEGTHLPAWQLVLFCNHWLQKQWDHATVFECLQWSPNTSVDWRSFCSEVTLDWLKNQQPIGGDGVIVEIDETYFVKRKNNKGRNLSSVWLFGGIERVTKNKFIVPLLGKQRDRSAATLIPIIKKYILPGSTIVSDGWKAYELLGNEGFTHWVVNHSEHFVDPSDAHVHTQNIERLWRDLKEWTKRPGMLSEYFEQYFSRYLFLKENYEDRRHQFFLAAGRLYKPQLTRQRPLPALADAACDTHVEDDPQPGPSSSH